MAGPRKQKPAVDKTKAVNKKKIADDAKAIDANAKRLAAIDEQFGDDMPYDYLRNLQLAKHFLQQSADAMLEAGRRLILIKEHEGHGQFMDALEKIDVDPRYARQLMQAAVKFSKRRPVANLGKTKMLELMVEDDEDLDELMEGGTVAGLTLDDIDRMSARQLRKTLRADRKKRQQEQETHERLIANKDKKINELDAALHRRDNSDLEIKADELSMLLERETTAACAAISVGLTKAIGEVLAWDDAPHHLKAACVHAANRVGMALHDTRLDYLQDIDATPDDDDAWLEQVGGSKKRK